MQHAEVTAAWKGDEEHGCSVEGVYLWGGGCARRPSDWHLDMGDQTWVLVLHVEG